MDLPTVRKIDDLQSIDVLIKHHQSVVRLLEQRAREVQQQTEMFARTRKRQAKLRQSPARVGYYLERGSTLESAITETADDLKTRTDTISAHWAKFIRSRKMDTTKKRELIVCRLAARKLDDQSIARKTGLHPKSVSRILKRAASQNDLFVARVVAIGGQCREECR